MSLNVATIGQRLDNLDRYLAELRRHQAATVEELRADFTRQLAVERACQAAVESCTDIAREVVSGRGLGELEEQRDLYRLLAEAGCLDASFADTMQKLVDFRNRVVHNYWEVGPEHLHRFLQRDLAPLGRFRDFALRLMRPGPQGVACADSPAPEGAAQGSPSPEGTADAGSPKP